MAVLTDGSVVRAVAEYTGRTPVRVELLPDPNVPGCHGGRATFTAGPALEFLIRDVPLQKVTDDDIEEAAFSAWPPYTQGRGQ